MPTPDVRSRLNDTWAIVRGEPLFLRVAEPAPEAPVILHLHGFAISGSYMTPTATLLADDFRTYVPDLPGFGRSLPPSHPLTIPELADSAAHVLDTLGVERATVHGAFAQRHPDRLERAIMVSPAGGIHNRPLLRAIGQLALDAPREPMSMATVAVPDYLHFGVVDALRLFVAMTRFPALEALLGVDVPLLVVLGARDPLLPPWSRIRQVMGQVNDQTRVAVLKDAAHAINYSHPVELAAIVRQFMADEPITGPPPGDDISPMRAFRGGR